MNAPTELRLRHDLKTENHVERHGDRAWYVDSPTDDLDAVLQVVKTAAEELEVSHAEVRIVTFWRRCEELEWLRDGMRVDHSQMFSLLESALTSKAFSCLFFLPNGAIIEPTFDDVCRVATTRPLPRAEAVAASRQVDMFETGWGGPNPTPYQSSAEGLAAEIAGLLQADAQPVLIEQWANGIFGLRVYEPATKAQAQAVMELLAPRSRIALLQNVQLERFDVMNEDLFREIEEYPTGTGEAWSPMVVFSSEASPNGSAACHGWDWETLSQTYDESNVSNWRFMRARRWYEKPEPSFYAVPDQDGVVRAYGGLGL